MKALRFFSAIALLAITGICSYAQKDRPWEYWRNSEGYLQNQYDVMLDLADKTLNKEAPSAKPSPARQLALAAIDAVLHDTRCDTSAFLNSFMQKRWAMALSHLKESKVSHPDQSPHQHAKPEAVEVIKLYNDGFIVRSETSAVGFDLCGTRGGRKIIPDRMMEEFISLCDALFISHTDPDHYDKNVVETAKRLGVPVFGPEDSGNKSFKGIEAVAIPGHQDDLRNNIWMITLPEKRTVVHFGDQWKKEDIEWLKDIKSKYPQTVDVLIIDCWAMEMEEMIKAFAPAYVISGHENEIGHTIDHREAYWLTQYKFDKMSTGIPSLVMAWGEWVELYLYRSN